MTRKTNYCLGIMIAGLLMSSCNSATTSDDLQKDADTVAVADNDGFEQIFDGKTLNGWEGDTAYWRAEEGSLVGEVTPEKLLKSNTFIIYKGGEPKDFELKLEFKITEAGNSGINYRSVLFDGVPYALKGYQADIDGKNNYTGQNYEERGRTTLAYRGQKVTIPNKPGESQKNAWTAAIIDGSLGSSDSLKALIKSNDWNTCHLIIKGNHLQHYINGILMSDVTDEDTTNRKMEGLLGIQVHVGPPMQVHYRNIMLKNL
ncbi:DUF1080 domain-containing protein [Agriterribacter sp.]|uniref:3-keto-disaccharide hydrolase n=1 Tax=Agriterribacter sp. TaxID=2821509 RepID=UPI002CE6BFBF|nr:DUF1080 domain-containing protein [Agriterribacter sp.]HRO45783.1 DUF1080 domain-containing protein [Agriterribacter sp.]HRQ16762.1 DUF1080 domain-containing protein [Agriterribacter sp.]